MGQDTPFDGPMQQAASVVHDRLEDMLLELEPRIIQQLGGDFDKAWQVMTSALLTSALQVMAYMEPDEDRYVAFMGGAAPQGCRANAGVFSAGATRFVAQSVGPLLS